MDSSTSSTQILTSANERIRVTGTVSKYPEKGLILLEIEDPESIIPKTILVNRENVDQSCPRGSLISVRGSRGGRISGPINRQKLDAVVYAESINVISE